MAGKPGSTNSSNVTTRSTTSSTTTSNINPATSGPRILRSPSHESVTTDLSLFSVSSLTSDAAALRLAAPRGPSPCPEAPRTRPTNIPEILWFEEENDVMRSCAALSAALGVHKSFSTSDICAAANSNTTCGVEPPGAVPRSAVSELALSAIQRGGYFLGHPRLEHASRSCSTWVAVGDVASTSQLPSPHGGHAAPPPSAPSALASSGGLAPPAPAPPPSTPSFTAADLVRSVNKKVRQNYIRRRLLTTYKALERLSQSEFNLDRLEVSASAAAAAAQADGPPSNVSGNTATTTATTTTLTATNDSIDSSNNAGPTTLVIPAKTSSNLISTPATPLVFDHQTTNAAVLRVVKQRAGKNLPLTIRDVERERGKPLSKYERNMMIFNWLHTLDNSTFEGLQ